MLHSTSTAGSMPTTSGAPLDRLARRDPRRLSPHPRAKTGSESRMQVPLTTTRGDQGRHVRGK